jgi:thiol:disulfide interchange protein DsbD
MLLAGAAMLMGALGGAKDPLQPLGGIARGPRRRIETPPSSACSTVAELDARHRCRNKPVMLDFYADWCVSCKEMERFTFSDARVQQKLANTLLLQADVTANSEDDKALLKRFNLFGPPGIIFFDTSGKEIGSVRVVGFQNAETFLRTLGNAV